MKIKLSEINNCGKSLIFEAGEIDKLKEIAVLTSEEVEKAMKNITFLLTQKSENNEITLKEIKANIEKIRKSTHLSGIFKGLELEREKAIKWKYER